MTSADIGFVPTVIVHYEAGKPHDPRFHIVGSKVQLFVVDDNAPDDRIYEVTSRSHPRIIDELMPPLSQIGNKADGSAAQQVVNAVYADAIEQQQKPAKRERPDWLRVIK
ncbi:hypothetical protein [uncultured Methylobacterium sp.]|jgi:hypothetical protein|uniref:hypothetical protein n=1 Tax=uncultured Methylobacterium sp. TaxID=157278 RepID=UPI002636FC6B|nr:hypothetical protein [uncultured Methylobacterium sp.]